MWLFCKMSESSKDEISDRKSQELLRAVEPSLIIGHTNKSQLKEEK